MLIKALVNEPAFFIWRQLILFCRDNTAKLVVTPD